MFRPKASRSRETVQEKQQSKDGPQQPRPSAATASYRLPPGCRASTAATTQGVSSSGIADLDAILHGGLPLSALTLLDSSPPSASAQRTKSIGGATPLGAARLVQDGRPGVAAWLLARTAFAEGRACGQRLVLVGPQRQAEALLRGLPSAVGGGGAGDDAGREEAEPKGNGEGEGEGEGGEKLKIAWRYGVSFAATADDGRAVATCHAFDFGKEDPEAARDVTVVATDGCKDGTDVMARVQKAVDEQATSGALVRVLLLDVGTPAFPMAAPGRLMRSLARLARARGNVLALATMLGGAYSETERTAAYHEAAVVLAVEPFSCTGLHHLEADFPAYHGCLHIHQARTCVSSVPLRLEASSWVYRARRRRFIIEKMHLPPEGVSSGGNTGARSVPQDARTAADAAKAVKALDF